MEECSKYFNFAGTLMEKIINQAKEKFTTYGLQLKEKTSWHTVLDYKAVFILDDESNASQKKISDDNKCANRKLWFFLESIKAHL